MSEADTAAQSRVVLDIQKAHVEPDITLIVGDAILPAHSSILRFFSSCAAGLPEPFQEWDLTNLRIGDGAEPPTVDTVLAWLEWLYWTPSRPHSPSNIVDAMPLLQFADAVGTNLSILEAIAKSCEWAVSITEPGPNALTVKLVIDSSSCYKIGNVHNQPQHQLLQQQGQHAQQLLQQMVQQQHQPFGGAGFNFGAALPAAGTIAPAPLIVRSVGSGPTSLKAQAVVVVERLLHVALTTHLTELFEAIQAWVRLHMGVPDSLLCGSQHQIFSPRVMQALGTDRLIAG